MTDRHHRVFNNMEFGWRELLLTCLKRGRAATPRGYDTLELPPTVFTLTDPGAALIVSPERKLNYAFCAAEFCWVMAAEDEVDTLAFFNSKMRDFADVPPYPDRESMRLFGAYGPPIVAQLPYVLENLREPDSRQAVITIWRQSPPKTRDVPCTVMLQFLLREGRLNMLTVMRSNDLWLGTPYDVPLFCRIQHYVASQIGAEVGEYTHVAGSLHLYERDLAAVWRVLDNEVGYAEEYSGPRLTMFDPTVDPRQFWAGVEAAAHRGDYAALNAATQLGWSELARVVHPYIINKRAKEASGGA